MAKILVVDDEADLEILIKQKFRKKIRENLYEFVFASNGVQAIEQLKEHSDVSVVLTDINMPEMDGLSLLSKLTADHSLLRSIIVSAYGDMDNIRTAMNRGAFDFITKPINFDDLELTMQKTIAQVDRINETVRALRENNILKMYVDETVLKFMTSTEFESSLMANETIEASVAFIDICGFTAISEKEPPNKVVELLNNYFDVMVKEIIGQGGYVDKFIGDAIMAVFRGDYHIDRAIDACLAIRRSIGEFNERSGDDEFSPKVSIGINSGSMICGNIGSSALRRLDHTVIGNIVNIAQRLQDKADKGQILITGTNYLSIKDSFKCKKVGEVLFKHKAEPETIYEVIE